MLVYHSSSDFVSSQQSTNMWVFVRSATTTFGAVAAAPSLLFFWISSLARALSRYGLGAVVISCVYLADIFRVFIVIHV